MTYNVISRLNRLSACSNHPDMHEMRGFRLCGYDPFPQGEAFLCNVRKRTRPGQNRSESIV